LSRSAKEIRLATFADAERIHAIYAPYVRDTVVSFEYEVPSVEEMRARIAATLETHPWIVLERDGEIAGYAYASKHRERPGYRWSADVSCYVDPRFQRQGIGGALYRSLLSVLRAQGFCNAYAGIALPNAASVALHESVGFVPLGIYRGVGFKLGRWHDAGWWSCRLRELPAQPAAPLRLAELGPRVLDEL
jgi:phosphinothricin acetyltransferase